MVLNTLANNKLYSNLIKILSVYNICNRQRLMNCELKLPSSSTCLFNIANLNTTESNNFLRCTYTSFYQIYANFGPYFVMKNFHSFQSSFFFNNTHSERDNIFFYTGSWLYRFQSDAEVVPFHWSPHHIPLEWPVWHCLIECNFHLYHGFLHVHFWTHLFSMKAIINDTLMHSSSF